MKGYCFEDVALHSGVVLRSCARHAELVEAFLAGGKIFDLIKFAHSPSIEVSSDAFCTLREMLVGHKVVAARWLEANSKQFFHNYNSLLRSGNYCTERQAQKLIVDLFLDRDRNFLQVMMDYMSSEINLAINMNLLKDGSKAIQVDAFQLFKLFVGNPEKPPKIELILLRNRERIISLLDSITSLRPEDTKFTEDIKATIKRLSKLPASDVLAAGRVTRKRAQTWQTGPSRPIQQKAAQISRVKADTADDIQCFCTDDADDAVVSGQWCAAVWLWSTARQHLSAQISRVKADSAGDNCSLQL